MSRKNNRSIRQRNHDHVIQKEKDTQKKREEQQKRKDIAKQERDRLLAEMKRAQNTPLPPEEEGDFPTTTPVVDVTIREEQEDFAMEAITKEVTKKKYLRRKNVAVIKRSIKKKKEPLRIKTVPEDVDMTNGEEPEKRKIVYNPDHFESKYNKMLRKRIEKRERKNVRHVRRGSRKVRDAQMS